VALTQMGSANMMVVRGSRAAVATELARAGQPGGAGLHRRGDRPQRDRERGRKVKVTNSEHAVSASDSVLLSGQHGDSVTFWC
jgi:hypothetical protein